MRNPELELAQMMQSMRPASSKTENNFIKKWLTPLGADSDAKGNMILRVPGPAGTKVLWSSHTDTVHHNGGKQAITMRNGVIGLASTSKSNCLGADCTTGVWLMREMILAQVPGLYVFHAAEECGGIGSDFIAHKTRSLLDGIDFAIAFDRYGFDEIITEQAGGMCASDEFAVSIAGMLPGAYKASPHGTFTDTANYADHIRECTNLAVGYQGHHGKSETQCVAHAMRLRDAMLAFDEGKLVASRKAGDNGWSSRFDDFDWRDYRDRKSGKVHPLDKKYSGSWSKQRDDAERVARSVQEFCRLYPDDVADLLDQYGINVSDLYDNNPWLS